MKAKFAEKRTERRAERFARLDADKNGQISRAEFDAVHAKRAGKPGEPGAGEHRGGKHHGMRGMRGGMRHGGLMGGDMFARMDANKDGRVTLAEASARPLAMFDKADANKDGTVTPEERKAAWQAMRAERAAKKG